jgi:hypothetical protein
MDHLVIRNWDTADASDAVQQMAHDMGFDVDTKVVPWWAKDLAMSLYKLGWRREPDGLFDPRINKEKYLGMIVDDMGFGHGGTLIARPFWVVKFAVRLVEAGWAKEEHHAPQT